MKISIRQIQPQVWSVKIIVGKLTIERHYTEMGYSEVLRKVDSILGSNVDVRNALFDSTELITQ